MLDTCGVWGPDPTLILVRSIKLLVADDSDEDAMLLEEPFRLMHCAATVRRTGDGQNTLEALLEAHLHETPLYDLIVLDYYLPKINAPDILERLRESGVALRTPVVILSSQVNPQEHQRLRGLGAALIGEKPSGLDGLCILARNMLECLTP